MNSNVSGGGGEEAEREKKKRTATGPCFSASNGLTAFSDVLFLSCVYGKVYQGKAGYLDVN